MSDTHIHPFPPVYDVSSRILILGTFPSVRSRENNFYYGHPRNRFWKTLSAVCGSRLPGTVDEKKAFLHTNHIALWATCAACEITGSADSAIRAAVPNDIRPILDVCDIRAIFCSGKTAYRLYRQHLLPMTGRGAVFLPSTSPANAAWADAALITACSLIRGYL